MHTPVAADSESLRPVHEDTGFGVARAWPTILRAGVPDPYREDLVLLQVDRRRAAADARVTATSNYSRRSQRRRAFGSVVRCR
jgi:hypothetical protein